MSLNDPILPDTRPPTFAKGQAFGGVPHSRVFISGNPSSGIWKWTETGAVILILSRIGDDGNFGFVQWQGEGDIGDDRWEIGYGWQVLDPDTYTVEFFCSITRVGEIDNATYGATFTPAQLVGPISLGKTSEQGIGGAPPAITKFEIPEWAEPLKRWPDAALLADQP